MKDGKALGIDGCANDTLLIRSSSGAYIAGQLVTNTYDTCVDEQCRYQSKRPPVCNQLRELSSGHDFTLAIAHQLSFSYPDSRTSPPAATTSLSNSPFL